MTDSFVVILCGGSGTRLWPVSRPSRPKQFAALLEPESLFLHTVRRSMAQQHRKLVVVAGQAHLAEIERQLESAGFDGTVLIEPEGRDSGPAIAAAAAYVASVSPDAVMFILASDHYIPDADAFQASLAEAEQAAHQGLIATLGIMPTHPSTAYGYICPQGQAVENRYTPIVEFKEKPDSARAEQFLRDGYLWNSGNFVATAGTLLSAFETFEAELAAAARRAVAEGASGGRVVRLGPSFHEARRISVDFAVMERAKNLCVVPVAWAWSDLGAWDAVHGCVPADEQGNVRSGKTLAIDTTGSLIRAEPGMVVATVGLRDVAVIADRDAVLVCRLDASQAVKTVVDALKRDNSPVVDLPAGARPLDIADQAAHLRQWLFNAALPLWWCAGADHVGGGFRELIGQDGAPTGDIRRCRVQSRQAYVFALAGAAGWSGPWRAAVAQGLEALERFYKRPDGLYRTLVGNEGQVLDDDARLYDQAFVLLALASARHLLPDAETRALQLLDLLEPLRHAAGGFRETGPHAFVSNPHMHLFEACLAWVEAGGSARWRTLAGELATLACQRFIQPDSGALHEVFDEQWVPTSDQAGQGIEPGHQFEWAWLLERWARLADDDAAATAALALFEVGEAGVDRQRGVALDVVGAGASNGSARLWPQTERLKAAALLQTRSDADKARFHRVALEALGALRRYLDTPVNGLWRDKATAEGEFVDEPAPASSFYHIISAILALEPRRA